MGLLDGHFRKFIVDTGERVQIFGERSTFVELGKLRVRHRFLFVDIEEDCILGLDFLSRYRCSVDLENNCLHIAGVDKIWFNDCSIDAWSSESGEGIAGDSEDRVLPEFLFPILEENSVLLGQNKKQLGKCKVVKHRIDTGGHAPIKQAPRRVPVQRKDEVRQLIADMENQGVIEKSVSSWMSPVVLVKKKDGSTRFCIDYRQLNNITKKDSYPLPRIDDTLDAIAGSSWFTVLDLQSGYWQIEMDERDREKTAFSVGEGEGVKTNPEKISTSREWPRPRNKSEVKSFLGLCTYFSRFVKNDATVARPLFDLTENKSFVWSEEAEKAFEELKICLTSTPILAYPSHSDPFLLDTDASNDWESSQRNDPYLELVFKSKLLGKKPPKEVLTATSPEVKFYFSLKGTANRGKGLLQIYNVGSPFERIALDILGPLPKSFPGNRFMLVVADYFTRWPEVIPLPNFQAKTVANALIKDIVSRHGVPQEIHSDQGRTFESNIFKELMILLGTKKTRTTPPHPQSDGLVERSVQHESLKLSPSMMLYGREICLPLDLLRGSLPIKNVLYCDFNLDLRDKMDTIHKFVRKQQEISSFKMKQQYDSKVVEKSFREGDLVWLYQPLRANRHASDPLGPTSHTELLHNPSKHTYTLPEPSSAHINNVDDLKHKIENALEVNDYKCIWTLVVPTLNQQDRHNY
ncbi:uncharacterized protein LOC143215119 [Lasioglossum baleicum]|uniref:uncharacterized protein LOC143215119 n=1 Tax=Lasioglossum baleicum TaxID=434251 RepID=UPI003FCD4FAA